ncbi:CatA-like O-acetyltransferase, family 2 [Selenomonas ruminantium]|nr:CatA-like O-acetyltransferase, family 2 [Selenomonas ruminantium]
MMKTEISPQESSRAEAFSLWMSSPMPMVTLVKTLNVSPLLKMRKKSGIKFTALMCWCIGRAASRIEEFYLLPEDGKLFRYDKMAINVIVANKQGGINSCDIPFADDLEQFNRDYLELTQRSATECKSSFIEDCMIIGTSAMIQTELDCIVNQYTEKFSNPLVMWGKYRQGLFKTVLPVSFQFHHVQMDGGHAARFLEQLQMEIKGCSKNWKTFVGR